MAGLARVTAAPADCGRANAHLVRAQELARSAAVVGLGAEASFLLMYYAADNAVSSVLAAAGRRVTTGLNHHQVAIVEALAIMGESGPVTSAIETARRNRNHVSYDVRPVTAIQLKALTTACADVLKLARAYVASQC